MDVLFPPFRPGHGGPAPVAARTARSGRAPKTLAVLRYPAERPGHCRVHRRAADANLARCRRSPNIGAQATACASCESTLRRRRKGPPLHRDTTGPRLPRHGPSSPSRRRPPAGACDADPARRRRPFVGRRAELDQLGAALSGPRTTNARWSSVCGSRGWRAAWSMPSSPPYQRARRLIGRGGVSSSTAPPSRSCRSSRRWSVSPEVLSSRGTHRLDAPDRLPTRSPSSPP